MDSRDFQHGDMNAGPEATRGRRKKRSVAKFNSRSRGAAALRDPPGNTRLSNTRTGMNHLPGKSSTDIDDGHCRSSERSVPDSLHEENHQVRTYCFRSCLANVFCLTIHFIL
jgi:hypothetical protein